MIARARLLLSLPVALAACGTEPPGPGQLTVSVDPVPPAVAVESITLTGTVTRSPALDVPILVRVLGGQEPVEAVAGPGGAFTLDVLLRLNLAASLTVSARDSTGSASGQVTLAVRHDARGPSVLSVSPTHAAADVAADQVIVVTFSEPVDPAAPAVVSVRRGGRGIPVTAVVAPDSLSLTLTPAEAGPGALHQVLVGGFRDALGNVQPVTFHSCFSTAPPAGASTLLDPVDDVYSGGDPTGLTPSDFLEASLVVGGTLTHVLLRFRTARAVAATGANAVFGVLDLDYDRRGDTGWPSFKDYVFSGMLPASGVGADHAVVLAPIPELADSSFFGRYVDTLTIVPLGTFVPVTCGTIVGFALDNGGLAPPLAFHMVAYFETGNANGAYADPAPDADYYVVNLAPPARGASAAPSTTAVRSPRAPIRLPRWSRF